MKKVLAASVALLMAGSAAYAAESTNFSVTGDARARMVYNSDYDFGAADADSDYRMNSRVRFQMKGQAAGGAYVIGRVRMSDTTFDGGVDRTDDKNIWVDKAYIGVPFSDELTLEAGKYYNSFGYKLFYQDINVSGFKLNYRTDAMTIIPYIDMLEEGYDDVLGEDNDLMRYGLATNFKFDGWNAGFHASFISDGDDVRDEEGFEGSAWFNGKFGDFGVTAEVAYVEEDINTGAERGDGQDDAIAGFITGTYAMDALSLALQVGATTEGYVADDDFGFIMLGGAGAINLTQIGGSASDGEEAEWTWLGFTVDYAISDALSLKGNIVYADIDDENTTGDEYDTLLEVSGALAYTISEGATFTWGAGMVSPEFENDDAEDDAAFGTYIEFAVSF